MNFKVTKAVYSRAEDLSNKKNYSKKYDIVISKAVAPVDKLYDWGKNFINKSGKMICIKGGDISDEINSFKKKNQNIKFNVINYRFDSVYNIEDKKIVLIL